MTTVIHARIIVFDRPRPLTDYLENGRPMAGKEAGGLILPPLALDALAASKTSGQPCEIVATGEEWTLDGRHYLTFGVSRDYIEATTDYRHEKAGLAYVCPECGDKHGQHRKMCGRG